MWIPLPEGFGEHSVIFVLLVIQACFLIVQVKKSHVSRMLPETFSEQSIRVFSKRRDEGSVELARKAFVIWAEGRGLSTPIASGDTLGVDMNETQE